MSECQTTLSLIVCKYVCVTEFFCVHCFPCRSSRRRPGGFTGPGGRGLYQPRCPGKWRPVLKPQRPEGGEQEKEMSESGETWRKGGRGRGRGRGSVLVVLIGHALLTTPFSCYSEDAFAHCRPAFGAPPAQMHASLSDQIVTRGTERSTADHGDAALYSGSHLYS